MGDSRGQEALRLPVIAGHRLAAKQIFQCRCPVTLPLPADTARGRYQSKLRRQFGALYLMTLENAHQRQNSRSQTPVAARRAE